MTFGALFFEGTTTTSHDLFGVRRWEEQLILVIVTELSMLRSGTRRTPSSTQTLAFAFCSCSGLVCCDTLGVLPGGGWLQQGACRKLWFLLPGSRGAHGRPKAVWVCSVFPLTISPVGNPRDAVGSVYQHCLGSSIDLSWNLNVLLLSKWSFLWWSDCFSGVGVFQWL